MTIRDAVIYDLSEIVAIYNSAIPGRTATADTQAITVESRQSWFERHTPDRRPLWVAQNQDGEIIGWLGFSSWYEDRPAYRRTAEISVYVSVNYQRRGIAKDLLGRAIAICPSLEITTLLGLVFSHNAASLALFGAFGFERWGLLPRIADLDGVERDLMILGRRTDAA